MITGVGVSADSEAPCPWLKPVDGFLLICRYVGFQLWPTEHCSFVSIQALDGEVEATLMLWMFERKFCKDFSNQHLGEALSICSSLRRWHLARITFKESERGDARVE